MKNRFPKWPHYDKKCISEINKVLNSGNVNYWTGQECRKFEKEFCDYFGAKYSIALANGTVALDLSISALGIGKGDQVIVTSRTFIASVSSIINAGATPVFADICANSQNITSSNIIKKINRHTKAIMCVHLAGWPCEMDNIMKIAKDNNLVVIEDCAQAHGAIYKGKSVGVIGDVGCWSFCQDKIMTTGGEGGMVTTNNKKLWEKMWSQKDHGKSFNSVYNRKHPPGFRWLHESFGTNYRMTEIQGCIGRYQLKKMPEWTRKRNLYQQKIWETCKNINSLRVPEFNLRSWKFYREDNVHGAYKCYVFLKKNYLDSAWTRDVIVAEINKRGVPCFVGSCSEVYREKAFFNHVSRPKKRLRVAKELGETSIAFEIHPNLSMKDINKTCKTIEIVLKAAEKSVKK